MHRAAPVGTFTPLVRRADLSCVNPDRPEGPVSPLLASPTERPAPLSPMALLESGIPLSLLLDLVCGPDSADLLDHERAPA